MADETREMRVARDREDWHAFHGAQLKQIRQREQFTLSREGHMDTTSISEMERQEQEALAALEYDFPEAQIKKGCEHRYAIRIASEVTGFRTRIGLSQWWEEDTLPAVRQRIVWALAHR